MEAGRSLCEVLGPKGREHLAAARDKTHLSGTMSLNHTAMVHDEIITWLSRLHYRYARLSLVSKDGTQDPCLPCVDHATPNAPPALQQPTWQTCRPSLSLYST